MDERDYIAMNKDAQEESKEVEGIFIHYKNGAKVNITDLPRIEYEHFLSVVHSLRLAYLITKKK